MDILSAIPQLASLVEKGGVVGLLLLIGGVLVWEVRRLRRELSTVYQQRSRLALFVVKLKTICEMNKIQVDLSDVQNLLPEHAIES